MKLKNTTGEGRKICGDHGVCFIVEIDEVFTVGDKLGATLIAQGFTAIKPTEPKKPKKETI